jgi:ornithine cyclodeaminase/alanine dehydrogenase-like protein (mu-crystallin family)
LTRHQAHDLLSRLATALEATSKQNADSTAEKVIQQPLRTVITTAEGNTRLFMPVADAHTTCIKVATIPERGESHGTINLFSQDGTLKGVLSAAELTAFRTALATMTLLTRTPSVSKADIVIFGAGKQAEWHARLAVVLFGDEIERITLVNRSTGRMSSLCGSLTSDLQKALPRLKIEKLAREHMKPEEYAARLREILNKAAVIHCCTPSTEPLFHRDDLGLGSKFMSLIGSYKPHMQEVDTETLLSGIEGKVYVDSKDASLEEAGELIKAGLSKDSLIELGDLFGADNDEVHASGERNIVFKCVGMAIMDLTVANALLDMATAEDIGQVVEGF